MPDTVANQVLQMIAQQQRTMHEENTRNRADDRKLLESVSQDVGEVNTVVALMNKDLQDVLIWRRDTADPHIRAAQHASAISKGAFKERAKNVGYAMLILGAFWVILKQWGGEIGSGMSKLFS